MRLLAFLTPSSGQLESVWALAMWLEMLLWVQVTLPLVPLPLPTVLKRQRLLQDLQPQQLGWPQLDWPQLDWPPWQLGWPRFVLRQPGWKQRQPPG